MSGSETGSEDQGGRPPRGGGGPAGGILDIIILAGVTKLTFCFSKLLTYLVYNDDVLIFTGDLASRTLVLESKRFYLDVKENTRGRFIKIAEISADGRKNQILMTLPTAGIYLLEA